MKQIKKSVRNELAKPAEAQIESEMRYRRLFETAQDGILILDGKTGEITDANPFLMRMLGYSHEEFLGKQLWEIGLFKDIKANQTAFLELEQKEYIRYDDLPLETKDGRRREVEFISNVYLVDHKRVIQCNIRDITERKQVEEALKNSENRFRALIENGSEEISIIGTDGTLLYESPSVDPTLGYGANKFLGQNLFQLIHPDDLDLIQSRFVQLLQDPGLQPREQFRLRHFDGTWHWVEAVGTNLLADPGVGGIVLNYHDITERKQAEQAQLQSEQQFRALFELSPDAVVLIDPHNPDTSWPIVDCNAATCQMIGYSRDELIGRSIDILNVAPGTSDERIAYLKKLREAGSLKFESSHRHKNGIVFPIEISTRLIQVSKRELVIGIDRDITERKQAEEQIRSRTDQLIKLYVLSRALANADDLDQVLGLVTQHATENVHSTFTRIVLLEGNELVVRGAYPTRVLDHDLLIGKRTPVADLPYCQRVLDQQDPVILHASHPDLGDDERAALLLDFVDTICLVPLTIGGQAQNSGGVLGLIMLGEARSEKREPFTPGRVEMARSIGDQAATAIRRMRLREKTQQDARRFAALHSIDLAISASMDLGTILNILLEQVVDLLKVDAADVLLFNPRMLTLDYSAGRGFRSGAIRKSQIRISEGYAGRAVLERRTFIVPDLQAIGSEYIRAKLLEGEDFVAYFGVPLITKGNVIGVLDIFNRSPLTPDSEWLDFMEALASQAAIAIESTTLFSDLQRSNIELSLAYDATIEGWSHAMDLRDKETEGHTQRVTDLTVQLAQRLRMREPELVQVRRGALLHDMGKMGVPDGILLKPGPLTDEEWVIMRRHPEYAFEMLSPIAYLRGALDIPYCHHERWDGTGYPRGLKGEEIPLAARVFAVVDVWDALRSDRPYRKAWSEEKVREHIRSGSGSHFDPQVVELFIRMLDEKAQQDKGGTG